jgi:hypothetical protein
MYIELCVSNCVLHSAMLTDINGLLNQQININTSLPQFAQSTTRNIIEISWQQTYFIGHCYFSDSEIMRIHESKSTHWWTGVCYVVHPACNNFKRIRIVVRSACIFVISIRLSLGPPCISAAPPPPPPQNHMDFREMWYVSLSWISVEEIPVWLKLGKNTGHFTCRRKYVLLLLAKLKTIKAVCWNEMASSC